MDEAVKMQLLFQTLGEANRLRIIRFVGQNKRSVSEIVKAIGLSQPLVSHHLRTLRENSILETERKGPFVYYKLKYTKLLDSLGLFAEVFKTIQPKTFKGTMFCCPPGWMKNSSYKKWTKGG